MLKHKKLCKKCGKEVVTVVPVHSVKHVWRGNRNIQFHSFLTHCGRVTQICVFNTVKLGTSASSPYCHSKSRKVSRGFTPSSTIRVFGEYFLKISVHKNG